MVLAAIVSGARLTSGSHLTALISRPAAVHGLPVAFAKPVLPLATAFWSHGFSRCVGPRLSTSISTGSGGDVPTDDPTDIVAFAKTGPLYRKCLAGSAEPPTASDWAEKGAMLRERLGMSDAPLNGQAARRIYHLYLPLYFWLRQSVAARGQEAVPGPLVVGLSSPQGAGKTTLVSFLQQLLRSDGHRCAVLSIDDFYLTNAEQKTLHALVVTLSKAVAENHPTNRLLQVRGNAGTHDLDLGSDTIWRCRSLRNGESMLAPIYDKSRHNGQGDRADKDEWVKVEGPLSVILLEGWMLGFRSLPASDNLLQVDPGLKDVNEYLKRYEQWWDEVDAWVVVEVNEPQWVYEWRLEAEQRMRAKGKGGMTDDQVKDFVSRYMPAYKAYLPGLYSREWRRDDGKEVPILRLTIGKDRNPIEE